MENINSTSQMNNGDYVKRNEELYKLYLSATGSEKGQIMNELLNYNQNYLHKMTANGFWRSYNGAEPGDIISTLNLAFIETIKSEKEDEWGMWVWYGTLDLAKKDFHNQYRAGGISLSKRTKYRCINQGMIYSVVSDEILDYDTIEDDSFSDPAYKVINDDQNKLYKIVLADIIKKAQDSGLSDECLDVALRKSKKEPYSEIAAALNITEGAARKRYERAIKACQKFASEYEDQMDMMF